MWYGAENTGQKTRRMSRENASMKTQPKGERLSVHFD